MTEQKEKRRYTREFRLEAVRLYETSEKSMREIEQELGITPYQLSKWMQILLGHAIWIAGSCHLLPVVPSQLSLNLCLASSYISPTLYVTDTCHLEA